ncbi:MAG: hypothetical protein RR497_01990 [Oscillospiraceae bacterium]
MEAVSIGTDTKNTPLQQKKQKPTCVCSSASDIVGAAAALSLYLSQNLTKKQTETLINFLSITVANLEGYLQQQDICSGQEIEYDANDIV